MYRFFCFFDFLFVLIKLCHNGRFFFPLNSGRNRFFQPIFKLFYLRHKLPQQPILSYDFPVDVAALGDDPALLHLRGGNAYVGGIVGGAYDNGGSNRPSLSITACYNTGTLSFTPGVSSSAANMMGGIIGGTAFTGYGPYNNTITNCYNAGQVGTEVGGSGSGIGDNIGGIIGRVLNNKSGDPTAVSTTYLTLSGNVSIGNIWCSPTAAVGRIYGTANIFQPGSPSSNYAYDQLTVNTSVGTPGTATDKNGANLTLAQLTNQVSNTYAAAPLGWNFTTTWMWSTGASVNLPILRALPMAPQTPRVGP